MKISGANYVFSFLGGDARGVACVFANTEEKEDDDGF